ncbi:hypothetical protein BJ122_10722 [Rhodopseudomonas faecalis]|uniref:Uncharacterized protein n=1 Tax=Rhodopseudomonas faecalis TaxID=99655 RepID=A0A318TUG9_9BRAD|nr:hypothetical protein BJ122_10722 [Rhodopseudomonas faecalis]
MRLATIHLMAGLWPYCVSKSLSMAKRQNFAPAGPLGSPDRSTALKEMGKFGIP